MSDTSDTDISILQITEAEEAVIMFKYRAAISSDLIDSESVNSSDVCYL